MNRKPLALLVAAATLIPATAAQANWPPDGTRTAVCEQYAPCWNWVTMGNHKRGVIVAGSYDVAVSPCRYQRFMRLGLISRRATPAMKGDKLAMRLHCR